MSSDDTSTGAPTANPLTKMQFLIRRRDGVSRDELVANWFANHMPDVVDSQLAMAEQSKPAAHRYHVTLFDQRSGDDRPTWDGVAQLWFDQPMARPDQPHGTEPRDTFQQKAEPYLPWATTEYVIVDGDLPLTANTLNRPYPATRSGFLKFVSLVAFADGVDHGEAVAHWLGAHQANVARTMEATGGLRYVVSLSADEAGPYAGMAELYFADADAFGRFNEAFEPDGFERFVDRSRGHRFQATTEFIGLP